METSFSLYCARELMNYGANPWIWVKNESGASVNGFYEIEYLHLVTGVSTVLDFILRSTRIHNSLGYKEMRLRSCEEFIIVNEMPTQPRLRNYTYLPFMWGNTMSYTMREMPLVSKGTFFLLITIALRVNNQNVTCRTFFSRYLPGRTGDLTVI